MKDMVSVIIPAYNRQDYIKECVESVLKQSYQNFEIIIIDDGSTDNTLKICEDLCGNDKRIKLIRAQHGGVSAARNAGLDEAQGEFVFFLDSDDVIHPLLLETLVGAICDNDADIAGTKVAFVNEQYWDKVYENINKEVTSVGITCNNTEKTLKAIFFDSAPLNVIGGVMMRKKLIGETTHFKTDLFIGEDFYFIYENLIKGVTSAVINKKWYYARVHNSNSSWNYDLDGFLTRFYRRKLVWESEESFGRNENADRQKLESFGCYTNCIEHNDPRSAEVKKMQKEIKKYNKIIIPALTFKNKLRYLLAVYMPSVYLFLLRVTKKG